MNQKSARPEHDFRLTAKVGQEIQERVIRAGTFEEVRLAYLVNYTSIHSITLWAGDDEGSIPTKWVAIAIPREWTATMRNYTHLGELVS